MNVFWVVSYFLAPFPSRSSGEHSASSDCEDYSRRLVYIAPLRTSCTPPASRGRSLSKRNSAVWLMPLLSRKLPLLYPTNWLIRHHDLLLSMVRKLQKPSSTSLLKLPAFPIHILIWCPDVPQSSLVSLPHSFNDFLYTYNTEQLGTTPYKPYRFIVWTAFSAGFQPWIWYPGGYLSTAFGLKNLPWYPPQPSLFFWLKVDLLYTHVPCKRVYSIVSMRPTTAELPGTWQHIRCIDGGVGRVELLTQSRKLITRVALIELM